MAQLWELLEIEKGLTAVMGSGGKTGLLYELAEELRPYGTVLLATTTHIMRPPQYPFAATAAELTSALTSHGAACAGSFTAEGKLTAPDFPGWETAADFVLVEADGSKRLPPQRRRTVCVLGASAFGQTIRQAAHRPALYAALAGVTKDAVITPQLAARVLMAEGGFDVIYVNQIEDPGFSPALTESFARAVSCPVVVGSLHHCRWKKLR